MSRRRALLGLIGLLALLVVAGAVAGLLLHGQEDDRADKDVHDPGFANFSGTRGDWKRIPSSALDARGREQLDKMFERGELPPGTVRGLYLHHAQPRTLAHFVAIPRGKERLEQWEVVTAMFEGAGITDHLTYDSTGLGGTLACGENKTAMAAMCAFSNETAGVVFAVKPAPSNVDEVADLFRGFLPMVTVDDDGSLPAAPPGAGTDASGRSPRLRVPAASVEQ